MCGCKPAIAAAAVPWQIVLWWEERRHGGAVRAGGKVTGVGGSGSTETRSGAE